MQVQNGIIQSLNTSPGIIRKEHLNQVDMHGICSHYPIIWNHMKLSFW